VIHGISTDKLKRGLHHWLTSVPWGERLK